MRATMTSSLMTRSSAVALALLLAAPAVARAQSSPPPKPQTGDTEQPGAMDTSDEPVSDKPDTDFAVPAPAATATAEVEEEDERPKDLFYGMGARARWVSVPGWLLDLFTENNKPLSSYHVGLEFFRRKADLDFILGLSFQNMSPPDGNWLGKGEDPMEKTDFVQFRSLGMVGIDGAFIWHKDLSPYFGFHYGAGIGVAFVTGKILRTSSTGCTTSTLGDLSTCHPLGVTCTGSGCDEKQLLDTSASGGRNEDEPSDPHRFKDPNVPPVIPIVNVVLGIDLRHPDIKGFDFRIEGGFYNAFFLGGGVLYAF